MIHDAEITVGPNWASVPACSCGWTGEPTYDRGEATRKAYAHATRENKEEQEPLRLVKDTLGWAPRR